jgi:hypothetical protein
MYLILIASVFVISAEEVCIFGLDAASKLRVSAELEQVASTEFAHVFDVYPWTPQEFLVELRERFPGRALHGADYQRYWRDWTRGPRCGRVVVGPSQAVTAGRLVNVLVPAGPVEFEFLPSCAGACEGLRSEVCGNSSQCRIDRSEIDQLAQRPALLTEPSVRIDKLSEIANANLTSYLFVTRDAVAPGVTGDEVRGACFSRSNFRAPHACKPAVYPCLKAGDASAFRRQRLKTGGSDAARACGIDLSSFLDFLGKNKFDFVVLQEDQEILLGLVDALALLDVQYLVVITGGGRLAPALAAELDHHVLRQGFAKIWLDSANSVHLYRKTAALVLPGDYDRLAFRALDQELTKVTTTQYFDDRLVYSE